MAVAPKSKNAALIVGCWINFTQPGYYLMTVNSDDGFKITSPYGRNALSQAGKVLGYASVGRGSSGYAANPFANGSCTPSFFNIPAAGCYPFRMIWENGGGGINVEWTIFQASTNGDIARMMVGSTNEPGALQVYQTLLADEPYVSGLYPTTALPGSGGNGTGNGFNGPDILGIGLGGTLGGQPILPGTGGTNIIGQVNDITLQLTDGNNRTVNTNTILLSFLGQTQPVEITTNGAGQTTIVRRANTTPFWPSGGFGPVILTYQDNNGQSFTQSWNLATAFWGTLSNSYSLSQIDTTKTGFAIRTYQKR